MNQRQPNQHQPLSLPAPARWASAVTAGLIMAAITYPWWQGVTIWLGFTIALVAATAADMIWAAREMVPLPHIAILIAALQYGLAPWASNFYPSIYPDYQINDLAEYFAYAGPVLAAITVGFIVSGMGLRMKSSRPHRSEASPQLLHELDWLLWGGMAVGIFGAGVTGSLAFVVVLLATLRFVGVIGWMIVAAPGWKWRVAVLLLYEMYGASSSGMFHDLILWSLSLLAIYVFLRHVKRLVFVSVLASLVVGVFFLQDAKWTLREGLWTEGGEVIVFGEPMTFTEWTRPFASVVCLVDSATKFFTGGYSDESIHKSVTRFNQGSIIDRVMHHVPSEEPYAARRDLVGGSVCHRDAARARARQTHYERANQHGPLRRTYHDRGHDHEYWLRRGDVRQFRPLGRRRWVWIVCAGPGIVFSLGGDARSKVAVLVGHCSLLRSLGIQGRDGHRRGIELRRQVRRFGVCGNDAYAVAARGTHGPRIESGPDITR